MPTKLLEELWKTYPESHLHCDVTKAGQESYRVVTTLLDRDFKQIVSVEHYGTGDLEKVKDAAFERLVDELKTKAHS